LSDTERHAFQQAISSYSDLNRAFNQETPIAKLFMSSPDEEGVGGIGFAQTTTLEFTSDQTNANSTVTVLYNRAMDHWFFGLSGASNTFYFGGDESYVLGGAGADVLSGGSGKDYLVTGGSGTGAGDILNGYAGDDFLVAGDYMFGSRSQAQLFGGGGDDTFIVGNGRFESSGGEGSDTYVIAPLTVASNAPLILHVVDFNPLQDRLDLSRLGLASHDAGVFSDATRTHLDIDLNALLAQNQKELLPAGSVLSLDLTQPIPGGLDLDSILGHSEVAGSFGWSDLSISNFVLSA
jgi:Ca2+-binding RTX toxin-like protein